MATIHFDEVTITPLEVEVGFPDGVLRFKASSLKLQGLDISEVKTLKIEGVPGLPTITADGPFRVVQLNSSGKDSLVGMTVQVRNFHQDHPSIKAQRD